MTANAEGTCSGAKIVAASSWRSTALSITQWRSSRAPPCTTRCPIAAGAGNLHCVSSVAMRASVSAWLRARRSSDSSSLPRASRAQRRCRALSVDSASPQTSISLEEGRTVYSANLSEEEPLLSASTGRDARLIAMAAGSRHLRTPAPVADLRHVFAVLAHIELMALHGAPVTVGRFLDAIVE